MLLKAYPQLRWSKLFRCGTSRCYSGAFHCFALPRFALTKRTVPKPCTALPTRGGTSQIVAVPALIRSAPPALIRSDHCLRRSVLGEELSDPALCIEGQALCPGCRLAHNGSDALEISFRVFGAVFHHHFIVNMEDYLVPSRFQIVEGKFQAVPADGLCQVLGQLAAVGFTVLPACVGLFAVVDVPVIGDLGVSVVQFAPAWQCCQAKDSTAFLWFGFCMIPGVKY